MTDAATPDQTTRPTTVPDVLDAASALIAGGLDVVSAINTAVHGAPETRPGSPLTAEAKSTLIRSMDEDQLPAYPITNPDTVLAYWSDEVAPEDVVATVRRVAEESRTAERPPLA